jgi:hypothetical protein
VGKSIRQARDYGRKKGVGFCIATNGLSWIVFPVNRRDQVSFESSSCLIFHNIDEILQDDANEFRDILARQSVISGSLDKNLLGTDRDQHEQRRLNNIYDRSFSKINRTSIFPHIEREIITAFNEELLSDNVELLEKCYVQTPERTSSTLGFKCTSPNASKSCGRSRSDQSAQGVNEASSATLSKQL